MNITVHKPVVLDKDTQKIVAEMLRALKLAAPLLQAYDSAVWNNASKAVEDAIKIAKVL